MSTKQPRAMRMAKRLLPCKICGEMPEFERGNKDLKPSVFHEGGNHYMGAIVDSDEEAVTVWNGWNS